MGDMAPTAAKYVLVTESPLPDGTTFLSHGGYDNEGDALQDFESSHNESATPPLVRSWMGQVFFDHIHDAVSPLPTPSVECEPPFLLVCFSQDFDWTRNHKLELEEYSCAEELVERARALVSEERTGGGIDACELWEVYGIRVTSVRT